MPSVYPLHSAENTLEIAGGKGSSLSRLALSGYPVPDGFVISTEAYRVYVEANALQPLIEGALARIDPQNPGGLEIASREIREGFCNGKIPEAMAEEWASAYQALNEGPVAVRSSATTEDLPELSFAGQQDTFLNITNREALLQAVVACWSSLWTARAIGYRARNHISQEGLSLAVVVQHMVQSETSGVLFTANPVSGLRSESVIDATYGLGEALVSGKVEPDQYIVDTRNGKVVQVRMGSKALRIVSSREGGTETLSEEMPGAQALTDEQILQLAQAGKDVETQYGSPQDIEWAWAEGQLYLLQSRPITSLFPIPEGIPTDPLKVFFSFAAVQGMLDPVTPFGRSVLMQIFASGASLFGIQASPETQTVLKTSGERLWINITTLLRNPIGRRFILYALDMVEPTARQAVGSLLNEPQLQPGRKKLSIRAAAQLARFVLPLAGNVLMNMARPEARREMILRRAEMILAAVKARLAELHGPRQQQLAKLSGVLPDITDVFLKGMFVRFVSGVATGMASMNFLNMLYQSSLPEGEKTPGWSPPVMEVTRGVAHNPTTEMDLELWKVAQAIQGNEAALALFEAHPSSELAGLYQTRQLPAEVQAALEAFIEIYGGRGLAEIDAGRPRWQEDPTHIFEALGSYLQIKDSSQAPDLVFERGAAEAETAVDQLVAQIRKSRHGWIKAHLARTFAHRARAWLGMREAPKFFAVRMLSLLRWELLRLGQEYVQAGDLRQADDLVYLSLGEIHDFAAGVEGNWQALIRQRRESYQRELRRRQVPRLLLSDGRAYYEGIMTTGSSENAILGSPVSPGSVEGPVRVVLDPRQANLQPGEILVCPGTDPSWTPLFLTAGGLVMEVGGMMTHGAVVAREYGIPAVVGVSQATSRLRTGQRIRLDGGSGVIQILDC